MNKIQNTVKAWAFVLVLFGILPSLVFAQQKAAITNQDIWASGKFAPKSVRGMNWMADGRYYTNEVAGDARQTLIVKFEVLTGKPVDTLFSSRQLEAGGIGPGGFDAYEFNSSEQYILLQTEVEPIYRRSSKANYYIYDRQARIVFPLSKGGPQSYATFSPDGKSIAFARDNNMFVVDVATKQESQITTDGALNKVINGSCDWVYEEEFEFAQAFSWSADGRYLAYYRFDEQAVPTYNMQTWGSLYPADYLYKYPKAGEKNSEVSIRVYDLLLSTTRSVDVGMETDQYIPRIKWTKDAKTLSVLRMNRLQNKLELLHADAATGASTVIITETSPQYVEVTDDLTYLADGKSFVWSSDRSGYKHLYLYDIKGKLLNQITTGAWEVDQLLGIDQKTSQAYITSTQAGARERQLYVTKLNGKGLKQLSVGAGWHSLNFSTDFRYYLDSYSTATTPTRYSLHKGTDGAVLKVLEDNAALKSRLEGLILGAFSFFTFKTDQGTELEGYQIKPADFDPAKKYPVLMFVYGGPGNQQVKDAWFGQNYFWFQSLAAQGYVVVCVDNRGTGGRGAAFKKCTYAQLGKLEAEDQIATGRYLAKQAWVDPARIGIWGWSFGGYMTSLCMTLGADVFKAGIAVAPVTNWRFYDSIYTERYLKTPQLNASGYDDNSPVTHASKLKGKFLLVHGTGDDNVHFQNAVAMEDALIKANKQFSTFYYPNRNHGIYGGVTRLHLYTMMTDFLKTNL